MKGILEKKRKKILYPEYEVGKKKPWQNWKVVTQSTETKAQQEKGSMQNKTSKSTIERDIRRTMKILRDRQLNIGIEKVDMHKGIIVKMLPDSAMGIFIDKRMAKKYSFKLQKLERPLTGNSEKAIIHRVEVNVSYKNHIERIKMNVCNPGKTKVILGMPWLVAHNPEINQEIGEIKMPTIM